MNHFFPTEKPITSNPAFRYNTTELPERVCAIRYFMPMEICLGGCPAGLYHYVCYVYPSNDVAPVGYCAEGCPGHSSKDGAREDFGQNLKNFGSLFLISKLYF